MTFEARWINFFSNTFSQLALPIKLSFSSATARISLTAHLQTCQKASSYRLGPELLLDGIEQSKMALKHALFLHPFWKLFGINSKAVVLACYVAPFIV